MDNKKLMQKNMGLRELALGMMSYTGGSIIGPLILFGFLGYFVDRWLETKPLFLIIGILVAFVITNILIYKKVNILIKNFTAEEERAKITKQQEK